MLVNGIEAKICLTLIKGTKLLMSFESYNSRGENIASIDTLNKSLPDNPAEVNRLNIYDRLYGEVIHTFNRHLSAFRVETVDIIDSINIGIKNILEIREKYKSDDISITVPIELKSIELVDDVLEVSLECIGNQVESMTFNLRSRRDVVYKEMIAETDIYFDLLSDKLYKAIGYSLTSPDMVIIGNIFKKVPNYVLTDVPRSVDEVRLIFKYNLEIKREEFKN